MSDNKTIQHLTDETDRLNRALDGEVTKLAREIFLQGIAEDTAFKRAEKFYAEALRRERGLGKQAEMSNTHETAHKAG